MTNNNVKIGSISLGFRGMQNKTTMRHHYIPINIAKIKTRNTPNTDKVAEKWNHSYCR